ncbi:pentapeptide repeat-containing protein [Pengzhenrongella sicca]|uniref:Pentapeptide repeat-containing protein n=1 Tax=Pengzhenrongella sicca TaxID=2819238 RepID=A0A8A4ZJT4_9MICO|nr:pentapeptide repeat-containing protein [Pengzhenrongella sicca]
MPELEHFAGELEPEADYDGLELRDLDLTGQTAENARFLGSRIVGCVLDDVALGRAQLADTELTEVRAHTLSAVDSAWRDVTIDRCRLGAVTAYGSDLARVRFSGGKIDYLNLRDATLKDVVLEDCTIGELDLVGARLTRVSFERCRLAVLDVTRAALDRVDLRGAEFAGLRGLAHLRGATITGGQLLDLAPAMADNLGLTVTG